LELPDFIKAFPSIDLPLPADMVTTHVMKTEQGLAVFFDVHKDVELPPHSHKGQWGTVLVGQVDLTIDGATRSYHPGETYFIETGTVHAAKVYAGSKVMDIFEEPDRYSLKT
jgi:quercetin dioxygenase-like cupin family protein